ncbi:MAG: hypothetical protein FWF25_04260 [Propionibacteriaceae bacterium]|nr:hypothetical protein [Propionibacteriaceae bacterium]
MILVYLADVVSALQDSEQAKAALEIAEADLVTTRTLLWHRDQALLAIHGSHWYKLSQRVGAVKTVLGRLVHRRRAR